MGSKTKALPKPTPKSTQVENFGLFATPFGKGLIKGIPSLYQYGISRYKMTYF